MTSPRFSVSDFRAAVRGDLPFAPGTDYLLTSDGETVCLACAYKYRHNIIRAIAGGLSDGWRVVAAGNTYNDDAVIDCGVCFEQLSSDS